MTMHRIERKLKILSTVAVFMASLIAQSAGAVKAGGVPGMDKSKFKSGCEAGGGSYVESASNDTFSCNLKSGGTITCPESGDHPCAYSARLSHKLVSQGLKSGGLKIRE